MAMQVEQLDKVWSFGTVDGFLGGLNLSVDSTRIADEEAAELLNVVFSKMLTITDTGFVTAGIALASNPRAVVKFPHAAATTEYILIADRGLYKWNATLERWLILPGTNSTTASAGEPSGETSIAVTSGALFANGDRIALTLDNGDIHLTTVASGGTTNTLIITAAIPVGRTLPNGGVVFEPANVNGSASIAVDWVVWQAVEWLIVCNGADVPWRYNGTTVEKVPNLPGAGNFVALTCAVFNNHLFLGNVIEGGASLPYRIRRSDVGDPTEWTTGDAGFNDLLDFPDEIVKLLPLGPYLIAYRENVISRGNWVGAADLLIDFEVAVSGTGILGVRAVAQVETNHVLVANDGIYEYAGGYDVSPIGDKIFDHLYGRFSELNKSKVDRIWVQDVEELKEVWVCIPTGTSSYVSHVMRLHRGAQEKNWTHRDFPVNVLGLGKFQSVSPTTWLDLVGSWSDQIGSWLSLSQRAGLDGVALCCDATDQVFHYDYTATSDNGVAIPWRIESKDFTTRSANTRVDQITVYYKGSGISAQYSIDGGTSWSPYGTLADSTRLRKGVMNKQVVGEMFRFALSGTSSAQIGWFGLVFAPEDQV